MIDRSTALLPLVLLAMLPVTAQAQFAAAQTEFVSFAAGAGAAIPTGDLARVARTGLHGTLRVDVMPLDAPWFTVRGDVSFDQFRAKAQDATSPSVLGLSASAVFRVGDFADPHGIKGYLVAGGGYRWLRGQAAESRTRGGAGATVGAGLEFGLGDLAAFVEARADGVRLDGASVRWVPLVIGLRF